MRHDRRTQRISRTAHLKLAKTNRLLWAPLRLTLDESSSSAFGIWSSFSLNSECKSFHCETALPFKKAGCSLNQSTEYFPVSYAKSTSKPAFLKTLNGCKASPMNIPVGFPSCRGASADVTAMSAQRGRFETILFNKRCLFTILFSRIESDWLVLEM